MNWTQEETKILEQNYAECHCDELMRLLPNHTQKQIYNKANRMNLRKSDKIIYKSKVNNVTAARTHITAESQKKANHSRKEMIRKERLRMIYGLPKRTKLPISVNSPRLLNIINQLRYRLRRKGYMIGAASLNAFYDEDTLRSSLEDRYTKLGFRFIPCGESLLEEQIRADNNEQPFTDFYL